MATKEEATAGVARRLLQLVMSGRLILVRSSGFCEMGRAATRCRLSLIYPNSNDGKSLHISTAYLLNKRRHLAFQRLNGAARKPIHRIFSLDAGKHLKNPLPSLEENGRKSVSTRANALRTTFRRR
jgi:hypothetical protein